MSPGTVQFKYNFFTEEIMEKLNLIIENFYNFQGSVELGLVFNVKLLLPYVNPSDYRDAIVKSGNLDILNLWLAVHRVTALGQAMTVAIDAGYSNIVSRLLQDPRIAPSFYSNKQWICQAARGHIDIVNALLEDPRINPADIVNSVLIKTIVMGQLNQLAVIDKLLEDTRVVRAGLHRAIQLATQNSQLEIVERLERALREE